MNFLLSVVIDGMKMKKLLHNNLFCVVILQLVVAVSDQHVLLLLLLRLLLTDVVTQTASESPSDKALCAHKPKYKTLESGKIWHFFSISDTRLLFPPQRNICL